MEPLSVICFLLCAAGVVQSALMLLHAWEHRRYHVSRLTAPLKSTGLPRVTLFVPCKGMDVGMEQNLQALFEQHYAPLELCFLIESAADPAVRCIHDLAQRFPQVACRLKYTGVATDCGQKVHNLMQGTAAIADESAVLAFVDSDARPHPRWLSRLVDRLQSGKFAVATGYRWYVPTQPTFANRLLAAINGTVASVMGPHGFNLIWGGAWAIRAETFHALGLPAAWQGSLSDDLVVSRLVHGAKLKVAYEPHCLVQSPADFNWAGLAEFLRRQYLVARVYAPRWWRFAVCSAAISNGIFWGLAGCGAAYWLTGRAWQLPATALLVVYFLTALRGALATRAIRPFVSISKAQFHAVARLNVWGWPLVSLTIALGLLASGIGRTIAWRGIRYRLASPSHTQILDRPPVRTASRDNSPPGQAARSAA